MKEVAGELSRPFHEASFTTLFLALAAIAVACALPAETPIINASAAARLRQLFMTGARIGLLLERLPTERRMRCRIGGVRTRPKGVGSSESPYRGCGAVDSGNEKGRGLLPGPFHMRGVHSV